MNRNIAKKWCEELRSGKYKQGIGDLCSISSDGKKYCCLGVLCHMLGLEEESSITNPIRIIFDGKSGELSKNICDLTGISTGTGRFFDENQNCKSLATLNDSGKSFPYIADIIEKYVDAL